ncbi:hypothetical protein GCM10009579_21270 [Streptomyces javensis]|uniref:Uncharacterized protein n=1 Tax=Streptomyces javensis TaxID=114698 RepID=A0ABN1WUI7_9ACTN
MLDFPWREPEVRLGRVLHQGPKGKGAWRRRGFGELGGYRGDGRNGAGSAMLAIWADVELLPDGEERRVAAIPVAARVPFRNPFRRVRPSI